MSRTPKLGEVWVDVLGMNYTCIDEVPDDAGDYGWSYPKPSGRTYKTYCSTDELTPAPPQKPEWLAERWANVYTCGDHYTQAVADDLAADSRIGRLNLGTGEWVPCNGKQVLS